MKTTLTIISILLSAAVLVAQPATAAVQQESSQPPAVGPAVSGQRGDYDLFRDARAEADAAERAWLTVQERFEDDLVRLDVCSDEATQLVHKTRDGAYRALTLKADYYQKHRQHHRDNYDTYQKLSADRVTMRKEIEGDLRIAQRLLADLQERRRRLQESEQTAGIEAKRATDALEQLTQNTNGRVENLRSALLRLDEGQDYLRKATDLARRQEAAIVAAHDLLASESSLWQAYYDARGLRRVLNCDQARADSWEQFKSVRPPQ
jgi:hypothetical protein